MVYDRRLSQEEVSAVEAHLFAEWPGVGAQAVPASLADLGAVPATSTGTD